LYDNYKNIVDCTHRRHDRVNSKRSETDRTESVLELIRRLKDEKPRSLMGQIRWMLPDIETALDSGHSLTDIHAMLNTHGIELPYKQLSLYMGRIRREVEKRPRRSRSSEPSASTGPRELTTPESTDAAVATFITSTGGTVPLLKTNPLANLKRKTPSVPNFGGTANKDELY
jgi:hypothetical protein